MVAICDAMVAPSYLFFDRFDPKIGINLLPQHNLSNSVGAVSLSRVYINIFLFVGAILAVEGAYVHTYACCQNWFVLLVVFSWVMEW